jgi:hypothetical protein
MINDEVSVSELWRRDLVSESEAARMLQLRFSTWSLLKRRRPPPLIVLGKHKRILVTDLRAWLTTFRVNQAVRIDAPAKSVTPG